MTDELGALINPDRLRIAQLRADAFQCGDDVLGPIAEARIGRRREAGEGVDHGQDPDLAACRQLVMDKIHLLGDLLLVQGEVWRDGCVGRPLAEDPRGLERTPQEAAGRADARQRDPEGCRRKKMVTSDAKRKAVAHACTVHAVSQRRACLALTIDRSTVRYTSPPAGRCPIARGDEGRGSPALT